MNKALRSAGLSQLRLSESKKAAHVTYFCDGKQQAEGPHYRRFHAQSLSSRESLLHPCLRAPELVAKARDSMQHSRADFVLLNLANADLLGHSTNIDAAVQGIVCMDEQLSQLAETAYTHGYTLVVTADHGNAEEMLYKGQPDGNHSTNPVPFIVASPKGSTAARLRSESPATCLGAVAPSVLDLLGIAAMPQASLLLH